MSGKVDLYYDVLDIGHSKYASAVLATILGTALETSFLPTGARTCLKRGGRGKLGNSKFAKVDDFWQIQSSVPL